MADFDKAVLGLFEHMAGNYLVNDIKFSELLEG